MLYAAGMRRGAWLGNGIAVVVALAGLVPGVWTPVASASGAVHSHVQDTGFLNRTVTLNGISYKYQVYVPEGWNRHQRWPMILFLHGSGERGSDGMDETQIGLPNAIRSHPERWPFVVVMPQDPFAHHYWTDPDIMAMAVAAFDAEVKEFNGDPQRLYLTGLSLGGYGTWEIAKDYPGKFAAVAPISGGIFWSYRPSRWKEQQELPREYVRAIGKTPVWMFHGLLDPVVVPKQSEIMYQALQAAGGDVRLWEFEGWHHNAWDKAYTNPALPLWFLAHRLDDIKTAHAEASRLIVPLHPVPAKVDPEIYDAYEGDYFDQGVRQVTIIRSSDRLLVKNRTGDLTEVLPETATVFFYPTGSATRLIFQKNAEGKVTGILYRDDRHEELWEREK
jgi:poly(3-hydroxybutyrate) depolymerase